MKLSGQWEHSSVQITANICSRFVLSISPTFVKEKMTVTQWTVGLLLVSLYGTHALSQFPENFVVAKRNDNKAIVLTCGTGPVEGLVTWKHNGGEIEKAEYDFCQEGGNLTLSDVEMPDLGEYSCWSGDDELSSTYLLMEAHREEESDSLLSCWAESYHCSFSCEWTNRKYPVVRLGLGTECTEGQKSCPWVTNSHQTSKGELQFKLHHHLSPYAEETKMLEITAEALKEHRILRVTKRFYLRDIVRPDVPTIVSCQREGQDLNVSIEPPTTWSIPHSFFRLEHQIEYILQDDGTTRRSSSVVIPQGISQLRVRSRDSLVMSNWSQWTPWKNVMPRKKKHCRYGNREKYCCPEFPSEVLNRYKKKRKGKRTKTSQLRQ